MAFKVGSYLELAGLRLTAMQEALDVDGNIGHKLAQLFNKTNGVLVAALMSTIGMLASFQHMSCRLTESF